MWESSLTRSLRSGKAHAGLKSPRSVTGKLQELDRGSEAWEYETENSNAASYTGNQGF